MLCQQVGGVRGVCKSAKRGQVSSYGTEVSRQQGPLPSWALKFDLPPLPPPPPSLLPCQPYSCNLSRHDFFCMFIMKTSKSQALGFLEMDVWAIRVPLCFPYHNCTLPSMDTTVFHCCSSPRLQHTNIVTGIHQWHHMPYGQNLNSNIGL